MNYKKVKEINSDGVYNEYYQMCMPGEEGYIHAKDIPIGSTVNLILPTRDYESLDKSNKIFQQNPYLEKQEK